MKRLLILGFLFLVFSLIIISGCEKSVTYYVKVTISVVDEVTEEIIPNATVHMSTGTAGSGSGGIFTFTLVGEKKYSFIYSSAGYGEQEKTVQVGKEDMSLTFKMSKMKGTIKGIVVDEAENPVNGAKVTIVENNRILETDNIGNFNFIDIPVSQDIYTIEATKTGYAKRTITNIKITPDELNKDLGKIVLSNTPGTLTGKVTDLSDRPIDSVTITVLELGKSTTTDYSGIYTIEALPGTYTVEYSQPSFLKVTRSNVQIKSGSNTSLFIQLTPKPGSLSGTIVDNYGSPISNVQVNILGTILKTNTISNGYFHFNEVPPGIYTLDINHPSFKSANTTAAIQCGQENNLGNIIISEKTGILTGRVIAVDDDSPIANASIRAMETGVNCSTNSDGYFILSNIRIGTYSFEITANNYSKAKITNIEIKENTTSNLPDIKLLKNPLVIMGTVKDSVTQEYLQGVTVTVVEANKSLITDNIGFFNFDALKSGSFTIKFESANYNSYVMTNVFGGPNQTLNLGNVMMTPKPGIIIGNTTPGALVELRGTSLKATATGSGAFTILNIVRGNYDLDISMANYYPRTIPVNIEPNQTLNIGNLNLTGLPGKIMGQTNATSVKIVQTDQTVTPVGSVFTLNNVAPGTYTIRFTANRFYSNDTTVTIGPNETKDLGTVTLAPKPSSITGYTVNGCTVSLIEAESTLPSGPFMYTNLLPGVYHLKIEQPDHEFYLLELNITPEENRDVGGLSAGPILNYLNRPEKATAHASSSFVADFDQTISFNGDVSCTMTEGAYVRLNEYVLAMIFPLSIPSYESFSGTMEVQKGNIPVEKEGLATIDVTYKIDNRGPRINFTRTWGYGANVYVTGINAVDQYTGVTKVEYAITNTMDLPGTWKLTTNNSSITIGGTGVWYLFIKATDQRGNVGIHVEGPYYCN